MQLPILRGEVSPEKEVSLVSYNFLEARDGVDILTMQTDRKPNDIWINDNMKNNNCLNNKRLEWRSLPEVNTQIFKK